MDRKLTAQMLNKVPEVTIFFWIIKVLCTTVGETFSDFLNVNLGLGLTGTSVVMGVLLAAVLFLQFRARRYVPGIYWLTVVLISVFGTLVTDNLTDAMGVPLELSTVLFSVALAVTFGFWYAGERTLSIHSIHSTRREAFYWLAILFTFALGTAAGDLMAESLGLGYLTTGLIVVGVIACTAIAWKLGLDAVLSFWIIYIMTRPLGASLGDLLSQPLANGGLGLGAPVTSLIFLIAILLTVVLLTLTRLDRRAGSSAQKVLEVGRKPGTSLRQTAAVLIVLLALSGFGYQARHSALASGALSSPYSWNDLTSFRAIEQQAQADVDKGDTQAAKDRATDLENAWDDAQAYLKPLDSARWSEVDVGIDQVLSALRSPNQNAGDCTVAIEASLQTLQ